MTRFVQQTLLAAALLLGAAAALAAVDLRPVPDRPQAEDFTLPDTAGEAHSLSDYRGRFVLVNFWAEWCPPCVHELPSMQRAYEALHGKNFEILAVHVGPGSDRTGDLLEKSGVGFPVLMDADLALGDWGVRALPSSYLIDPQGRVIYRVEGAIDWDSSASRDLLDRLLGVGARDAGRPSSLIPL